MMKESSTSITVDSEKRVLWWCTIAFEERAMQKLFVFFFLRKENVMSIFYDKDAR